MVAGSDGHGVYHLHSAMASGDGRPQPPSILVLAVTASWTLATEGSGAGAASQIQAELIVHKEFISAETAS